MTDEVVKIWKQGERCIIELPHTVLEALGWVKGDHIMLHVSDDVLSVKKLQWRERG